MGLERPRSHASYANREDTYKARWIRKILRSGTMYGIRVLEECSDFETVVVAEIRWIDEGRKRGWPLTNTTDGGEGAAQEVARVPVAEIVARYALGESVLALACAFGVSRSVITSRLRKAGTVKRTGSEQNKIRMSRTPPEQRKANAAAAQAATRGKPWDPAKHSCRVCGVAGHTSKSQKFHPGLISPGPGRRWTKSAEAIRLGL